MDPDDCLSLYPRVPGSLVLMRMLSWGFWGGGKAQWKWDFWESERKDRADALKGPLSIRINQGNWSTMAVQITLFRFKHEGSCDFSSEWASCWCFRQLVRHIAFSLSKIGFEAKLFISNQKYALMTVCHWNSSRYISCLWSLLTDIEVVWFWLVLKEWCLFGLSPYGEIIEVILQKRRKSELEKQTSKFDLPCPPSRLLDPVSIWWSALVTSKGVYGFVSLVMVKIMMSRFAREE